jgi:hypothetical protein
MIEPNAKLEYRVLKFDTHSKLEQALNEAIADGWQYVSYQAAGDSAAITHFLVLSKEMRPEPRRFGF